METSFRVTSYRYTYAQFPSLPYNPDENGDGLIGVVLQGLLANYGNEFASAVISEDGPRRYGANAISGLCIYLQVLTRLLGHSNARGVWNDMGRGWK